MIIYMIFSYGSISMSLQTVKLTARVKAKALKERKKRSRVVMGVKGDKYCRHPKHDIFNIS